MSFWDTTVADRFAWGLPGLAVVFGVLAGILVLGHHDDCAAWSGIIGSVASGGGIYATYIASRKRDDQIRFWINATSEGLANPQAGAFGS